MSTAIYLSGNDSERLPCPYPPFDREPVFLENKSSPSIPVFTYRSIPSPLVPSILGASSRAAAHPEASPPSSSDPDSGSESSDGFGYHRGYPSSPTSSSHANHKNSFDFEFGRGQDVKSDFPSGFSTASTSPTSSHDHLQQLPVSLPIEAPEWMWIFSRLPDDDNEETEEFAEMIKEDSRRITFLKKFEGLKKHNHLANLRNEPLIPVPNNLGLTIPVGSCCPITSIAQIFDMPLTELDSWLSHYGLQSCAEVGSERMQRLTLAQHVGAVSPDDHPNRDVLDDPCWRTDFGLNSMCGAP